jgi:Zn-dependent metalloprotease
MPGHHPIHCILPPHVLERIAMEGNAEQRAAALRTISRDNTMRAARAQNAAITAQAGRRISPHVTSADGPQRSVFDCQGREDVAGARLMRAEGDAATGDKAVDEAYDGFGATFTLFSDAYQRDSIDDEGMPLSGYVHYGQGYDNAFWDGQQMVFGDGDGELFNRFTISIDVIGHELTHGVTEDEAQLVYFRQPGALNESISDVFGSLVKQHQLNQKVDEADWLIGAGLIAGQPNMALRSMKAPGTAYDHPVLGKDPQPADMSGYVHTTSDNGGVHINSGIPNHAFALAALNMGGYAWETAGSIWYEALRDSRLRSTAQFRTFARTTLRAAERLGFSPSSQEYRAVKDAWSQVGLAV